MNEAYIYDAVRTPRGKGRKDGSLHEVTSARLSAGVLNALKEAIITHQLKPGQFYSEVNLAEELGVSRTPVREALISLESMHFVKIVRGRGFQINSWTPTTVGEIYLFRKMLEMTIIRLVTSIMTLSSIEELNAIHEREMNALQGGDVRSHQLADRDIHLLLAERTENPYLFSSMIGIRDLVDWVGYEFLSERPHVLDKFTQEHIELIDALKQKDTAAAEAIMSDHIDRGEIEILKAFELKAGKESHNSE